MQGSSSDSNPKWISEINVNNLMRARRQRPRHYRCSQAPSPLAKRADESAKLGMRQRSSYIHGRPRTRKATRLPATARQAAGKRSGVAIRSPFGLIQQAARLSCWLVIDATPAEIIELHRALAPDFDRAATFKLKGMAQGPLGIFGHLNLARATVRLHSRSSVHGVAPDIIE